ncbi:MAG: hypothetical protein HQL93_11410 [Magnetococcales bacterium]|nr:hypothetical protein [Magnetococcales bacterium]
MNVIAKLLCFVILASTATLANADSIPGPTTFSSGTPIRSSEINDNFLNIYNQVNKIGSVVTVDQTNGRVGVGTTTPEQTLSVNGTIESKSGGFQFPDGQIQSAAVVTRSNYMRVGNLQIAWGKDVDNTSTNHVRLFSITFPQPFSGIPTVTTRVDSDGTGNSFAVYDFTLSKTTYTARADEIQTRSSSVPTTLEYIAIGPCTYQNPDGPCL